MKKEDWKELNEKSHYNSLKKQDIEHRKLIKKLQIEVRNLKEQSKLFGVGIELPTEKEITLESNRQAKYENIPDRPNQNLSKYLGFMNCLNWLKDKNKVKR